MVKRLLIISLFLISDALAADSVLPPHTDKTNASSENYQGEENNSQESFDIAQVRRRRPGAESAGQRKRVVQPTESSGGAVTPQQAEERKIAQPELFKAEEPPPPYDSEFIPVEDRWTMLYDGKWYDPYNQNIYKGDLKLFGTDANPWFLEIEAESFSLFEQRRNPTPTSLTSIDQPGRNDIFGSPDQTFFNQNFIFEFSLINGNTTFKPQDFEIRIAPVFNINMANVEETGVLRANPSRGTSRDDAHFSLLAAFIDYHIVDISKRYDFISIRAGVQEFNADFRGLVLNEAQPGIRLFGNIDNNLWQWNAAFFHRLKLDANALLPILFESRDENVWLFNLYRQDLLALGHTVQFVYMYRDDSFGDSAPNYDENDFITNPPSIGAERPKNLDTHYIGLNSDGHFGRLNVNSSLYWAFGSEDDNPIADRQTDINAYLAALELSLDVDWYRPKLSFVWASGDKDPFDDKAEGFDAIFDNPNFAGGQNSYWVRQGIPYIGGGGLITLTDRSSFLPDLRAGKAQGQSNFVNPGIMIFNAGVDVDVTPKLIWENNVNYLRFDRTGVLRATRSDGSIGRDIGIDISTALFYRPLLSNNLQFKVGYAQLLPGDGFKNLFGDKTYNQFFGEATLLY